MDVTWLGHGCFRLRGRGAAVVTDPYPPSLGPKLPRLEADLITVSHQHENHSYTSAVSKEPFVVGGPGEYEVVRVKAAATDGSAMGFTAESGRPSEGETPGFRPIEMGRKGE